jgi:fatty-acid desaturase
MIKNYIRFKFFIALPMICLFLTYQMFTYNSFWWIPLGILLFYFMHQIGFSIGIHKALSHNAFVPKDWFLYTSMWVASMCFYGNPLHNILVHRIHHRYSDTDRDPHSPMHGIWHAFIGWIWKYQPPADSVRILKDVLIKHPWLTVYGKYEWVVPLVSYSILYFVSYSLFLAVLLGGILSMLNGLIINGFAHNPKLSDKNKAVDNKFAARWINPIFLHKYHHDVPGLWDYSNYGVDDFSAPFIKKFLSKSVR